VMASSVVAGHTITKGTPLAASPFHGRYVYVEAEAPAGVLNPAEMPADLPIRKEGLQGPTCAQKFALTHLTPSMVAAGQSLGLVGKKGKGKKKRGKHALSKVGGSAALFFNEVGTRPHPRYVSLEQTITVELEDQYQNFFTTSTSVPVYGSTFFALSQFDSYTEYTGLFDQYRIDQLEVWVEPAAGAGSSIFPLLATAVDLDDTSTPTAFAVVAGKMESLVSTGAQGRYHKWVPHVAIAEYSGSFTSYGNLPATWIDSASPSVQHYGFKIASLTEVVQAINYNLTVRAVVSFRAPGI
jgi:hypothetical protein